MLDSLKIRVDELIRMHPDEISLKKYQLIKKIIEFDNSFTYIDANTAISIIMDLDYSLDVAKEIYLELLKEEYSWNIQES